MRDLLISMRPYQWMKNLFVFMPLVFGHKMFEPYEAFRSIAMFILFSLSSSAMYLVNDLLDIEGDRLHPDKRNRPIAAGKVGAFQAAAAAAALGVMSLAGSFLLDPRAGLVIAAYLALNYAYTVFLKKAVIIDAFCIGAFFYLRVLAGSVVTDIMLSEWIILCTVLLALFLAFNKRRYDLQVAEGSRDVLKKYNVYFIDRMVSIVSASIVIAYSLYTIDPKTVARFGTNHLLYTIPFVYYGIFRYLYLADKKDLGGDPALILLKDGKMKINLVLWIIVCVGVIYFKI